MKAPDKIYLSVGKGEDWAYAMWTQKTPEEQKFSKLDEHEEYIRKDALMEKIDEILNAKPDGGLAVDIAAQALVDIREVINSM